jgi:hypothetical protein
MRRNDLLSSLFFAVCGLLIAAGSLRMTIGRLGEPGPGFLPLIVGTLLALVSAVLFIQSLRRKKQDRKASGPEGKERFKVVTTSLSLILYAAAFKPLGFILVTFFLLVFLFKVIGGFDWKASIAGPALITFFFYLLFAVWLEVQFPPGPFGI